MVFALGAEGREFESHCPDTNKSQSFRLFFPLLNTPKQGHKFKKNEQCLHNLAQSCTKKRAKYLQYLQTLAIKAYENKILP